MKPFDQYPGDGVTLLPKDPVVNTRRADGPPSSTLDKPNILCLLWSKLGG